MRAIVVRESLIEGKLPPNPRGSLIANYPMALNGNQVEILEFEVPDDEALNYAESLAFSLLPRQYFAQLMNGDRMLVVFPRCLTWVVRADQFTADVARVIGSLFSIPHTQMRFMEMFETDHPDITDPRQAIES